MLRETAIEYIHRWTEGLIDRAKPGLNTKELTSQRVEVILSLE